MSIEVKVPDLGDGIEGGDVLKVLVSEGDTIVAEQGVVELETDKAVAEIPSPRGGRVQKIHVKAGETVAVGGTLITLEESAAEAKAETKPAKPAAAAPAAKPAPSAPAKATAAPVEKAVEKPAAPAPREAAKPTPKTPAAAAPPKPATPVAAADNDLTPAAGPAMRRLARELGVDLGTVDGSGPGGRILKDYILSSVRAANRAAAASRNQPAPSAATVDRTAAPGAAEATILAGEPGEDKWGPVRRDRLTRIRATIAERMQQSSATIPHVTNFDDADITELEKLRQASKRDYAASGVRLTTLPFVLKAVALSLKHHPALNASLDLEAGEVIYKQYVNLGVAVDTDRGLIVPNLRNADQMPIPQLAQALEDLGRRARGGQFTIDDLRGGTFSISNLGAIGGTYSTPIINAPEVAILLLGRARQMPVVISDKVEIRLMLPLSLSYDHRLVDGAVAARFLNEVKGLLEAPGRLLLAP